MATSRSSSSEPSDAPPRPLPRAAGAGHPRGARRRLLLGAGLLSVVAACGGSGSVFTPENPPEPLPDGITGVVLAPDQVLGRMAEREPNDTEAQAYRLPAVWARCRIEVAGNLGQTAGLYGAADPSDVFRFLSLADADVTLTLGHAAVDPVGGGPNIFEVEVRPSAGSVLLSVSGPGPLTGSFPIVAGQSLIVTVRAITGHGPWLLGLSSADPPPVPKPRAGTGTVAARGSEAFVGAALLDAVPAPFDALGTESKPGESACAADHLLVRLRDDVNAPAWAAARGLVLGTRTGSGTWRVRFPIAANEDGQSKAKRTATSLAGDASVAWAEPDWIMVRLGTAPDADFARQWNLAAIGAPAAWDATQGASSVVVGVVDTGVVDHPDLQGQLVPGYDFISDPAIALDGDVRDADPTDRGDSALGSGLSSWHGTHVAAIIVGRSDAGGIVGIASGCRVMPLRVLGKTGGLSSDVADAILFAAGVFSTSDGRRLLTPLRIVNLSLGSPTPSAEIENACSVAAGEGVLLVAAVGNEANPVSFPAAFPTVMAVGAADGMLDGTSYSNHGSQISVCAPGGTSLRDQQGDGWPDSILSAVVDQTRYPSVKTSGYFQGTSQAAPHVAATAALLLSLDPALNRAQLRQRIEVSALDRGIPGFDQLHGNGFLQTHLAVKRLRQDLGQPLGPPALHLPVPTLRFIGLEFLKTVPVSNSGGGTLEVVGSQATTDDGSPWLAATLVPNFVGADCNVASVEILVNRLLLPANPGWFSGTVRLYGTTQPLGLLRVTVSVNTWSRVGQPFRVVAIEQATGGVRADGSAHPQNDYRYWLRGLPPLTYIIKSGDDLDADGFFCEPNDLCGWHGGPTEADATPLALLPGLAFTGIDITVR